MSKTTAKKTSPSSIATGLKSKIFLSVVFLISLLPMLANQYTHVQGVTYLSGLTNIAHIFGIVFLLLVVIGIWAPLPTSFLNHILSLAGLIGIVACEIITFLYIPRSDSGSPINLGDSFAAAQPEFYLGLLTSLLAIFIYICVAIISRAKKRS